MVETGVVESIDGAAAVVRFERTSACGKCGACGMMKNQSEISVSMPNTLDAKEGDSVKVELYSGSVISASFISYVIPLIMLILGVLVGYTIASGLFGNPELSAAVFGIAFTAAAFLAIRMMEPYLRKNDKFKPRMVEFNRENDI